MPQKLTTRAFIEKARLVHGERYDYSRVEYTLSKNKLVILCQEHGEFQQTANSHLAGNGCAHCITSSYAQKVTQFGELFIQRARIIHGSKYDYSKSNYLGAHHPIEIACPEHGPFNQTPNKHLLGCACPSCGRKREGTALNARQAEQFIAKARAVHGNNYDYSQTAYTTARKKLIIICHQHGPFEQLPGHHVKGNGCPQCAVSEHASRTGGYSKSSWAARQNGRAAVLYLLRLHNSHESFYKVGRTFCLPNRRTDIHAAYQTDVVKVYTSFDANEIWEVERLLLKKLKHLKYTPSIPFNGKHECISDSTIALLIFPNS